jgi:anti-anti-sigma factor
MPDDLAHLLRTETGAGDRFRISVVGNGDTAPIVHEFKYPYAVVGRGEGCDIVLPAHQVSFRHAYFQVIEGQVYCVDLASRNGVAWPDGPRKYGWVRPNVPIEIGPYRLTVVADEAGAEQTNDSLADLNPLERYRGELGLLPKVDLEFHYEEANQPTWPVNRILTLLGRSPVCRLRLDSSSVSGVHCGLLLTRRKLWVIDLLGRGGTKVDGQNVRILPLESGNEILVSAYRIGVFYEEPFDIASADRLTDNAAESETSMDELESAFLQDVPLTSTAPAKPPEKPEKPSEPAKLEWSGKIFAVDCDGPTLVITPQVEGTGFRYQQLHIEANALQRKFDTKQFSNLVVDLSGLNYFGSELIGVLIRLARTATNSNGRAAMCGPSPKMLEVLDSMRLRKLWPIFDSRSEALSHVKQ